MSKRFSSWTHSPMRRITLCTFLQWLQNPLSITCKMFGRSVHVDKLYWHSIRYCIKNSRWLCFFLTYGNGPLTMVLVRPSQFINGNNARVHLLQSGWTTNFEPHLSMRVTMKEAQLTFKAIPLSIVFLVRRINAHYLENHSRWFLRWPSEQ